MGVDAVVHPDAHDLLDVSVRHINAGNSRRLVQNLAFGSNPGSNCGPNASKP
jgi:hypothetical protein